MDTEFDVKEVHFIVFMNRYGNEGRKTNLFSIGKPTLTSMYLANSNRIPNTHHRYTVQYAISLNSNGINNFREELRKFFVEIRIAVTISDGYLEFVQHHK